MSLAAVQTEILEPMQAIFLPPRDMDATALTAALRGYGAVLDPFDRADLKSAWREVVAEHRTRAWPVPGAIVQAARKAQKDHTGDDAPSRTRHGVDSNARWLLWQSVRASQLASDAAEAGVAWSLKCAVLQDGKPQGAVNLVALIRAHASAEETARAIGDGTPVLHRGRRLTFDGGPRALALKMWANQLRNEDDTAEEIRRARSGSAAPSARGRGN
jgi:hypothetical protein